MRAHTITTTIIVSAVCVLAIPANASASTGGDTGYSSLNSISPPVSEPSSSSGRAAADTDSGYSSLNSISPPVSEPTVVSGTPASPADGFDWGDAALGAGAAMALAALGGAVLLTVRRRTAMSPSASTS